MTRLPGKRATIFFDRWLERCRLGFIAIEHFVILLRQASGADGRHVVEHDGKVL
jgi:hypothetical protein